MVYTEIRERNGKKYFYRVLSVRNGKKVSKRRKYLGVNLSDSELARKKKRADRDMEVKDGKKKEFEKLKSKIVGVLKKYGVKKAGVFGSFARGEQTKKSDVDVLAEIPKRINLFDFVGIKLELENRIGRKVDLVEYAAVKPLIKAGVLCEEVRII